MKAKTVIAWSIVLIAAMVPVVLLFALGGGAAVRTDYSSLMRTLRAVFGLVGMTLLSLTFVLSAHIPLVESAFGGREKVYAAHIILGAVGLVTILLHPLFVALLFLPEGAGAIDGLLVLTRSLPILFGIAALVGLVMASGAAILPGMGRWRVAHNLFVVVFVLAALHVLLAGGRSSGSGAFVGYYWYMVLLTVLGVGAFSYGALARRQSR